MSFYNKYWVDQPRWTKGVILLLGAVTVVGTGYAIYTGIKRRRELKEANKAADAAVGELVDLKNRGVKPSMTESQFQVYADKLVEAMNGCGTDEDQVYDVFRHMNNEADVRQLIVSFGVRYYRPCAADQPISYTRYLFNDKAFGGSLPTWLTYDLSQSNIDTINKLLKDKNINYSF